MMADMKDIDRALLDRVTRGLAKIGDYECCDAAAPGMVGPLTKPKLPPEIWEPFLRRIGARLLLEYRGDLEYHARKCESPIEELMFLALVADARSRAEGVRFDGAEAEPFSEFTAISICPQFGIGEYRIDFQVVYGVCGRSADRTEEYWRRGVVLVECDGHDYHERTKEQASHDKRRDRELQTAGFTVFRYTGSDIWRDCVEHAAGAIQAAADLAQKMPPAVTKTKGSSG